MTDVDAAFTAELETHRRMLRVHCYRMTGSFDEAEDLVQETFLRAWRSRASFEGRAQLATWLYRIATNVCLDALEKRPARVLPQDVVRAVAPDDEPRATPPLRPELPWLQPFPDRLLDPETLTSSRQSVELAFLAALQHLPPRQRAILILCDVLGWSAKEVAEMIEGTVASVTSALQRAHETMRTHAPVGRSEWTPLAPPSDAERELLARYMAAWERGDSAGLTALLRDDVRWAMPPAALWFEGRAMVETLFANYPMTFHGHHRYVAVGANAQLAAAGYIRPHGASEFHFAGITLLRVEGGQIAEITSFSAALCKGFELPMSFSPPAV
ncbi:MAG: sigma-70 family RNA polymerase sigma factor [Kofleriaceae bacterium]|nr:sigma-70 family RNA polymerase sigma factor [Kofleriaceae bacterium]